MKKYLTILMILCVTLAANTVGSLYQSNTIPVKINHEGQDYMCFNLHDSQIVYAKFKYLDALEESVTNLIELCEFQSMSIQALQSDLYWEEKKKRVFLASGIAAGFLAGVLTTLRLTKN